MTSILALAIRNCLLGLAAALLIGVVRDRWRLERLAPGPEPAAFRCGLRSMTPPTAETTRQRRENAA